MKNDSKAVKRKRRSKYQIYKYARFLVFTFIVIYSFYHRMRMPLSLVIALEILLLIRTLPVRKFIERRFLTMYPGYRHLSVFLRRMIVLSSYIMLFLIAKFTVMDIIMTRIMEIPVNEQLNELVEKVQEEALQELERSKLLGNIRQE